MLMSGRFAQEETEKMSPRKWTVVEIGLKEIFQMERHTALNTVLKRWLIVLAILFAPPFLIVAAMWALSWLLCRLFPSASFLAWLGIEGYAFTVLGMHVLLSVGLMGFMVRRWQRSERRRGGVIPPLLTAVAVPLTMPFLAFWPLSLLMRLSHRLFPSISSTAGWFFGIEAYTLSRGGLKCRTVHLSLHLG